MKNDWGLELGTYPGLLFGARTYEYPDNKEAEVIDYVLYIPFINVNIYNNTLWQRRHKMNYYRK